MLYNLREMQDTSRMLQSRIREDQRAGYRTHGPRVRHFYESMFTLFRSGTIDPRRLSLREVFCAFVEDGDNVLRESRYRRRHGGGAVLHEAADAVNTSHFSNIMGQLVFSRVMKAFENPMFIGDQLFETVPTDTSQPEIIPGITRIGDVAEDIGEGEEYPLVVLGEEFITTPPKIKDGFIVPVTEEVIDEDKTGLVMRMIDMASESMGYAREKAKLNVALGIADAYSRNGGPVQPTYNTTHTQGDFNNVVVNNPLDGWEAFSAVRHQSTLVRDPDTGEPVFLGSQQQVVVPDLLYDDALLYRDAIQVQRGVQAATSSIITARNPLQNPRFRYDVLTSPYIYEITQSNTTWFTGNFPEAFKYYEFWPLQVFRADRTSYEGFHRDIAFALKVRMKGAEGVERPQYVFKVTA